MGCHSLLQENESHLVVSDSLKVHGILQARILEVGSLSLLQGIFPTQGSNPGLPHCGWILYQLSHRGIPTILEWVAYPFSRGSTPPRNRTALQVDSLPTELSGKPSLLPGIFPTQGLNMCLLQLLHCWRILYYLNHYGVLALPIITLIPKSQLLFLYNFLLKRAFIKLTKCMDIPAKVIYHINVKFALLKYR